MEKALLHFLGGRRKTDVSALELRLIPAAELLQAQREAETLADGDTAALGLCLNACILARAAFGKNGKRAFADGAEVLRRVHAERIGHWAERYLALCAEENPPCSAENRRRLGQALENAPYERLKWRVLRSFGVLPSETRAREMTDGDYLYCVLHMTLDEEERLEQLCPECRAQAEKSLSGQSELLRSTSRLGDEIAEKKSVLAGYAAERETTEKSLASLESLRAQMQGDEQSRRALIEQYRAASEQSQREIGTHETEIAALSGKMAEKRAELEELSKAKLALEAERSQSDRRGRELNENVLNVERSVSKLEQKRATSAMEEQQILDKLWENYELSHSAAQEQRIELESVQKASRRIGELKRAISGLGAVNVGAIEEFERVNTRYTYLTTQRDDVEKAKGELVGVIDSITSEMTVIFKEQFALIRESFQETFLELFGGGKATLELEDENDVLSCGIEIKVQPPGKALKTITLLSGGEKAFVAIALYFAILKVHPTPFCVMDEIEAALDEPNVVRVANYMRRITSKTQFIVITHRRGTMEAADVLYGVTMQERGVSKVLTINMNDMAKELNIKE